MSVEVNPCASVDHEWDTLAALTLFSLLLHFPVFWDIFSDAQAMPIEWYGTHLVDLTELTRGWLPSSKRALINTHQKQSIV